MWFYSWLSSGACCHTVYITAVQHFFVILLFKKLYFLKIRNLSHPTLIIYLMLNNHVRNKFSDDKLYIVKRSDAESYSPINIPYGRSCTVAVVTPQWC
jgi:hypothetical protein